AICNYCNFNRGLFDPALKRRYVDALLDEIVRAPAAMLGEGLCSPSQASASAAGGGGAPPAVKKSWRADSIYFGGGTPSLLEPHEIGSLIAACRDAFDVTPDAEVTMEANPESVSEARLAAYREAGVNRVSFGVQSFRDDELRRLSRLHDAGRGQ